MVITYEILNFNDSTFYSGLGNFEGQGIGYGWADGQAYHGKNSDGSGFSRGLSTSFINDQSSGRGGPEGYQLVWTESDGSFPEHSARSCY